MSLKGSSLELQFVLNGVAISALHGCVGVYYRACSIMTGHLNGIQHRSPPFPSSPSWDGQGLDACSSCEYRSLVTVLRRPVGAPHEAAP